MSKDFRFFGGQRAQKVRGTVGQSLQVPDQVGCQRSLAGVCASLWRIQPAGLSGYSNYILEDQQGGDTILR